MRLFLIRHAEAVRAAPGEPDELRPLTAAGHEAARRLGSELAAHPLCPATVVTSPLARARETATAIAEETGAVVAVDERLAPGATSTGVLELLAGAVGPVAAVAHQPDCSQIALALTGADPGFPPGGMLELELRPG